MKKQKSVVSGQMAPRPVIIPRPCDHEKFCHIQDDDGNIVCEGCMNVLQPAPPASNNQPAESPQCGNCFYQRPEAQQIVRDKDAVQCHRYPQPLAKRADQWCGEHKPVQK